MNKKNHKEGVGLVRIGECICCILCPSNNQKRAPKPQVSRASLQWLSLNTRFSLRNWNKEVMIRSSLKVQPLWKLLLNMFDPFSSLPLPQPLQMCELIKKRTPTYDELHSACLLSNNICEVAFPMNGVYSLKSFFIYVNTRCRVIYCVQWGLQSTGLISFIDSFQQGILFKDW